MSEDEVRRASEQFYAALIQLINGNAEPMAAVWSHRDDVTTLHPLGGRQTGWHEVWQVWQAVAQAGITDANVTVDDLLIHVTGDLAYTVGVERGQLTMGGEQVAYDERATNIYRREGGAWKLVHHHSDLVPGMQAAMERMMAGQR